MRRGITPRVKKDKCVHAAWRVIGNSIAYNGKGEVVKVLSCGEAAEDFCVIEVDTIPHGRKGTALAEYLYD